MVTNDSDEPLTVEDVDSLRRPRARHFDGQRGTGEARHHRITFRTERRHEFAADLTGGSDDEYVFHMRLCLIYIKKFYRKLRLIVRPAPTGRVCLRRALFPAP